MNRILDALSGRFLALFILLLPWIAGYIVFMGIIFMQKPQSPELQTDAIIVVTGGAHRINEGLDLLATHKARKMLISGVNEKVSLPELLAMWDKKGKTDMKAIECCVTLGRHAADTNSNAEEAKAWLKANRLYTLRLVTSDYHMPRTNLAFRLAMPDVHIVAHPVKSKNRSPFGPEQLLLGFQEYNKTLLTLAMYVLPK